MNRFQTWEAHNLAKFANDAYTRIQELEDMNSHAPRLRELLRENLDGLTISQMADQTGYRADSINNTLTAMQDAYIDRWTGPFRGQWAAVWCVVVPPANCPKPTETK